MNYLPWIAVILLIAIIINPPGSGREVIKMDIIPEKSAYLSTENLIIYYYIYLSDGKTAEGGEGEWFLVYNWNDSQIAYGLINKSQGRVNVDLGIYNLTSMGYGNYLRFKLDYLYNGEWHNESRTIKVISAEYYYFFMNTNPVSGGYYPGTYVNIGINSPVGLLKVGYISIYSGSREFMNVSNPITLDVDGYGNYYFMIPEDAGIGSKINVSVEIEDKIETVNFTVSKNFGFYFYSSMNLEDGVLSGERVNLTVMSSGEGDGEFFHYYIYDSKGSIIWHLFTNNSNLSYVIPRNYTGYLRIRCDIYNSTGNVGDLYYTLYAMASKMYVYFDKLSYTRGDIIHFYVNFQSIVISSPRFVYNIFENYGNGYLLLRSITTDRDEIEIKVPETPPLEYRVEVHLLSNTSSSVKSAQIEYFVPTDFRVYILSRSPYVNGVFTPGERIELHFQIMKNDIHGARIYYGFGDEFYTNPQILILKNQTEGNIFVRIPKYAESGIYEIHLMLIYDGGMKNTSVFINVDSNPPWSLYGIFGIPLGDFIVILLLIALGVAVFLYIYPKKGEEEIKVKDSQ